MTAFGSQDSTGADRPAPQDRPVRPALTRAYIIRTALALIDRVGVAGLSMRKLGAELGADPMAVYHHLPNKSALFDGVVDAVFAEIDLNDLDANGPGRCYADPRGSDRHGRDVQDGQDGAWRAQLAHGMRQMRQALRRHPNALPVIATRPGLTPAKLALADRALAELTHVGFTVGQALDIINCLGTYTIGHALAEVGEPVGGQTAEPQQAIASVGAEAYPHLAAAFHAGYDFRPDEQYELGLQAMLDGFERLLATHSRAD